MKEKSKGGWRKKEIRRNRVKERAKWKKRKKGGKQEQEE